MGRRIKIQVTDPYTQAYEQMLKNPVKKLGSSVLKHELPTDIKYTKLEDDRTRLPRCMSCNLQLQAGTSHWFYNEPKNKMWWCTKCFKIQCGFSPPRR